MSAELPAGPATDDPMAVERRTRLRRELAELLALLLVRRHRRLAPSISAAAELGPSPKLDRLEVS